MAPSEHFQDCGARSLAEPGQRSCLGNEGATGAGVQGPHGENANPFPPNVNTPLNHLGIVYKFRKRLSGSGVGLTCCISHQPQACGWPTTMNRKTLERVAAGFLGLSRWFSIEHRGLGLGTACSTLGVAAVGPPHGLEHWDLRLCKWALLPWMTLDLGLVSGVASSALFHLPFPLPVMLR